MIIVKTENVSSEQNRYQNSYAMWTQNKIPVPVGIGNSCRRRGRMEVFVLFLFFVSRLQL